MRIALVDDDRDCREEMIKLCLDFGAQNGCRIEVVPFSSGEDYLSAMGNDGFDLVFMDVFMTGLDGVSTALTMRKSGARCILVFLTSSGEFMPEAFSCHAFEYVTKPFSPQRIMDVLRDVLNVLPSVPKYMEISTGRVSVPVPLDQIVSIVTDAHYLDITLADGTMLRSRITMPQFLEQTRQDSRFILINKGIAVNADYILHFEDNCCILDNGLRFPVRVRDRLKVQQAAQDYHFREIRRRQATGRQQTSAKSPTPD